MKKLVLSLVLLASSFANADISKVEAEFRACSDSAQNTYEINDCSTQAFKGADAELNRVYNSIKIPLLKSTSAEGKETLKRLVAAQKSWVTFRDADCNLEGTQELGGSLEDIMIGRCRASKTIERVQKLQNIFGTR